LGTRRINVADYAREARGTLPRDVLDYYEGGALDEITLRENTAGWGKSGSDQGRVMSDKR
jgi:isopentenyl diphosphate isomerase/L-lactate dehydrogenase-like FMN-dependent dehydrogenase